MLTLLFLFRQWFGFRTGQGHSVGGPERDYEASFTQRCRLPLLAFRRSAL
ncbi:hypothetical protein AB0L68_40535 [Streptomyces sp. NPDC052164]